MTPDLLRTFLAVRRQLNYTRAAEELFLSQPAVSRQVRRLETELGVRLFEQLGKTLHLTDAGRTLAAEAEKLLGAMERTAEAVRAYRSAEHGSLRIGASTTPGFYLLPPLIGRFHRRYPEVTLHYTVQNSLRIEQMIVHNELDLGFVGAHLSSEDLRIETILQDQIVCYAGPDHPLARRRRVPARALEGQTWVIREKGSATRRLFEDWFAAQGGRVGHAIELGCPEAAKALVGAGVGFSFISAHGLRAEIGRGELCRIPVSGLPLRRPIFLVRHGEKHTSPVMQAFIEIVQTRLKGRGPT